MKKRKTKGLFQLEALTHIPDCEIKKGDIVECFGHSWLCNTGREGLASEIDPTTKAHRAIDILFFLIWSPYNGWWLVERCHFKPVGAKFYDPEIYCPEKKGEKEEDGLRQAISKMAEHNEEVLKGEESEPEKLN